MSKYRKGARVRLIGTELCGAVLAVRSGCIPGPADISRFKLLLGIMARYRVSWDVGGDSSHWDVELERAPRRLKKD